MLLVMFELCASFYVYTVKRLHLRMFWLTLVRYFITKCHIFYRYAWEAVKKYLLYAKRSYIYVIIW